MNKKQLFSSKNIGILVLLIGVALVLGFVVQERPAPLAEVGEDGKPCIPLTSEGKQVYEVSTDRISNLQIVKVEVDPIDVKKGKTQKIIVYVEDKNNDSITKETSVEATIFTDTRSTAMAASAFKLVKAEDGKDSSDSLLSIWEGYWKRSDDSNCRTYMESITATNNKGEKSKVDLSFK